MSSGVLGLLLIAAFLYASYRIDKLLDRIVDLEAQVQELEAWRGGREQAEDWEIARQVAELDPKNKPLAEILEDALSPPPR